MTLSLRSRIVLTLLPLLAVLVILGGAGVALLHRLGGRIDAILRENYDSVIAMERLTEALERDPNHRPSHQLLADYFETHGEPERAAVHRKYLK